MLRVYKLSTMFLFVFGIYCSQTSFSQEFLDGSYSRTEVEFDGKEFIVYNFSRKGSGTGIKAKYFAQNANEQFQEWKDGKDILFYCSGAFSESWDTDSPPLGICVDNGVIVNRNIDQTMDGLVIVYNGGAQEGGIAVINIDKEHVNVGRNGEKKSYNLRNQGERIQFLQWAKEKSATVFQTQLMYTKSHGYEFSTDQLTYGDRAERRFLAICMKHGIVYHMVIDYPESDYLNRAAKKVISYLTEDIDYEVYGLFNLDTGGKNIMKAYDDDGDQIAEGPEKVDDATNLLVYYVD